MKGNIFTDIAATVEAGRKIREARKAGADAVRIEPIRIMPIATLSGHGIWGRHHTGRGENPCLINSLLVST